ncbi:hypothetical protein FIBSPDRAFT_924658 [Athelia psychrophila]|uniref:Uncharacterized protein n=1 Tax=Athelia psychrophila TaxID=1759441 RepID=A0A166VUU5_9AGAM|nr:hypothetical protein FIBSPDRAFT_924658 [Fibularhizoctonia sp. CBS 109695]
MSQIMISASSIDVRALDDSPELSKRQTLTHLFVLKIDGTRVLESAKVPHKSLEWKEQKQFRFTPSSNISIVIYRKSRALGWRRRVLVAEYKGAAQELVDISGTSRIAVKFDLVFESHADFMKAVDNEILQLAKVKGAGAAQTAATIGEKIGTVLEAIVPVLDSFASRSWKILQQSHPVLNGAWMVLSSAYKVRVV